MGVTHARGARCRSGWRPPPASAPRRDRETRPHHVQHARAIHGLAVRRYRSGSWADHRADHLKSTYRDRPNYAVMTYRLLFVLPAISRSSDLFHAAAAWHI